MHAAYFLLSLRLGGFACGIFISPASNRNNHAKSKSRKEGSRERANEERCRPDRANRIEQVRMFTKTRRKLLNEWIRIEQVERGVPFRRWVTRPGHREGRGRVLHAHRSALGAPPRASAVDDGQFRDFGAHLRSILEEYGEFRNRIFVGRPQ